MAIENMISREDIESLGWDLDQKVKRNSFYYHRNYSLITKCEFCLTTDDAEETVFIYDMNKNTRNSFYGYIKTKEELEVVMGLIGMNVSAEIKK